MLVLNAGSSTLKFEVCDVASGVRAIVSGEYADFAPEGCTLEWSGMQGRGRRKEAARSVGEAAEHLFGWLRDPREHADAPLKGLAAVAHRIVHGGERFVEPVRVDDTALAELDALSELAPLHNPPALEALRAARAALGDAMAHVAVFDTAYYARLPPAARWYAVPEDWRTRHDVRRYGFHGLAHRWLCARSAARLGRPLGELRIVSLQLGHGCSVTATRNGEAIDTSMGFTPLEGLVMGTRSGDIDAGAVLHVMQRTGESPESMVRTLNERSGLAALSGRSSDMRELLRLAGQGDERATLAVESFCRRARHYVGAFLAELGGADAIVFGGGIGEHQAEIRARILAPFAWCGIELDAAANVLDGAGEAELHAARSRVAVQRIAVRESRVIAADAARLLSGSRVESPKT